MNKFDFEYKIIRSKGKGFRGRRKTLSVYVRNDENASVEVRCGLDTPVALIEDFLAQKSAWITRKRAQILRDFEENSAARELLLNNGAKLPLLGQFFPLKFTENIATPVFCDNCFFLPSFLEGNDNATREALKKIYKKIARTYLSNLVNATAPIMNVHPTGLRITSAHTRWGSCSGKNSLNFSYRLIFADPDCIRYVVVHELAHIKHHDHSARFWSLVAAHAPDHRAHSARLKTLARSPWFRIL